MPRSSSGLAARGRRPALGTMLAASAKFAAINGTIKSR